jgi:hypothetical protein
MKDTKTLTLAAARTALDEIERRRSQFAAELARTGLVLEQAEAGLGEAMLAGDESVLHEIAELRLKADGLNAALAALDVRRVSAERDLRAATAADYRRQAAGKRAEMKELESKTERLLSQLGSLEDVHYDACILAAQRTGSWYRSAFAPGAGGGLALPEPYFAPSEVLPEPIAGRAGYAVPKSRRLRDEAAKLDAMAERIEQEIGEATPAEPQNSSANPAAPSSDGEAWERIGREENGDPRGVVKVDNSQRGGGSNFVPEGEGWTPLP